MSVKETAVTARVRDYVEFKEVKNYGMNLGYDVHCKICDRVVYKGACGKLHYTMEKARMHLLKIHKIDAEET